MRSYRPISILLAAFAIAVPTAHAFQHEHRHRGGHRSQQSSHSGMDMRKCMMDMQASQAKLDALTSRMNAAHGVDRMEAAIAVVAEMASQEKAMHQMCMMMMKMKSSGEGGMHGSLGRRAGHRH